LALVLVLALALARERLDMWGRVQSQEWRNDPNPRKRKPD
jgi:hypothetical protein